MVHLGQKAVEMKLVAARMVMPGAVVALSGSKALVVLVILGVVVGTRVEICIILTRMLRIYKRHDATDATQKSCPKCVPVSQTSTALVVPVVLVILVVVARVVVLAVTGGVMPVVDSMTQRPL